MCHLLPTRAVGMLGLFVESELVKYALALFPEQAAVIRHQGLQPTPA